MNNEFDRGVLIQSCRTPLDASRTVNIERQRYGMSAKPPPPLSPSKCRASPGYQSRRLATTYLLVLSPTVINLSATSSHNSYPATSSHTRTLATPAHVTRELEPSGITF